MSHWANNFNNSLDLFLREAKDPKFPFAAIPDDMKVLRAFSVAFEIGGGDTARKLSKLRGFNDMGMGPNFSVEKFVEAVSLLPLDRMLVRLEGGAQAAMKKELAGVFNRLGSEAENGFLVAKGAAHQLLSTINRNLAETPAELTQAFEKRVVIAHPGLGSRELSARYYDEVVKVSEVEINIDQKAWSASYLD